ncbi:MAG: serine hydrolase domain-containing protein [Planktomarina sp.]
MFARITFVLVCMVTSAAAHDPARVQYAVVNGIAESKASAATPNTPFAIASVGKTLTSVVVLQFAERGVWVIDDTVAKHLPEPVVNGLDGLTGITTRHLLTMTSGLPDYYDDFYLAAARDDPDVIQTPLAAISFAYDQPRQFKPDSRFDYSNTNYVLLGIMLEHVSGETYADILNQNIFVPVGMTNSFVMGSRPLPRNFAIGHEDGEHIRDYYNGTGFGDGGAISTAVDLEAFYRALFQGDHLLNAQSLTQMTTVDNGSQYGMGLVVDGQFVGHSGADLGFTSSIGMDRATGNISVILAADADADMTWLD